tara:strand:+ start:15461 stop:15829 length:369 start_codon:yes stop_codon:yes gene_type:complete
MNNALIRNLSLLGILASCGMAFAVYQTKNQVVNVEKELNQINSRIITANESIHTLKAEWGYLNTPNRLEKLNNKFLKLRPTSVKQIASVRNIPTVLASVRANRYQNKIIVADISSQNLRKRS